MDVVNSVSVDRDDISFDFGYSAHELPYSDNQFDLVTSFDVLEHIIEEDVSTVLGELIRVAKKRVIFSVCCRGSGWMRDKIGELHCSGKDKDWWTEKILPFCTKGYDVFDHNHDPSNMLWDIEV